MTLKGEMGGISTGIPPGFNRYNEMAAGMLQMGVDTFAHGKGYHLGDQRLPTGVAKKYTLFEDRDEIIQDIASALHTKVIAVLPKSIIEHRFAYRLLPSCNVLIGLDPRDFDYEPNGDDTPWETAGDF